MTKTLLLTGATGYLGSHLLQRLMADGVFVIALMRRAPTLMEVQKYFDGKKAIAVSLGEVGWEEKVAQQKPQAIIHAATCYGRRGEGREDIEAVNFTLPQALLQRAPAWGVQTFIHIDTALSAGTNAYAETKKKFRELLKAEFRGVGINLILEHFYGPNESTDKFLGWLVNELFTNDRKRIPLTRGEQERNFVFIDDVIRAILMALKKDLPPGFHEYGISTQTSIRLKELVELVAREAGAPLDRLGFGDIPYRPNELMFSETRQKAPLVPGWEAQIRLHEGIKKVVSAKRAGERRSD